MASIRNILNIFSREVDRGRQPPLLSGDDLIAFVRACPDAHAIDSALQQAGTAPFWPQDARMRRFFEAAQQDRPLAVKLKAAADLSMGARRHALAHMSAAPNPVLEVQLPRRRHAVVHLLAADAQLPENSHSFLRRLRQPLAARIYGNSVVRDMVTAWGGDITGLLNEGHDDTTALRHLLALQMGDMLRAGLQSVCDGALPARLDLALQNVMPGSKGPHAPAVFADLRIEIAATPRLTAGDRAAAMEAADVMATLLVRLDAAPLEFLFRSRDDRTLMLRGFGDRQDISTSVLWLDEETASLLARFAHLIESRMAEGHTVSALAMPGEDHAPAVGLVITRAGDAPAHLADRHHPHEALAEMALFARLIGHESGNRGLRYYWQSHEEAGVPSRIGSLMGLALGDLQQTYEELTRRDIYQTTPDLARLQDRLLARPLHMPQAMGGDVNDSA